MAQLHFDWLTKEENTGKVALLLFIIGLAVRILGLVVFPDAHISGNAKDILAGADLIRQGQFIDNVDFPMLIPPLTALFVAGLQALFSDHLIVIKLAQVVLDATALIFFFIIGKHIFGHSCGVLGSAIVAVYPFAVFVPLYIGTESLFVFLLAASILCVTLALKDVRIVLFIAAGLTLGLATLTRGTTLFLPVFLVPFFLWHLRRYPIGRTVGLSIAFLASFVIVLSPWIARNYALHDAFIPSSTSSGPLLHGSSKKFWLIEDREKNLPAYFDYLESEKGIARPANPNPTWVEKDRYYRRAAIEMHKERWRSEPLAFLPYFGEKFARLWYGTESGRNQLVIALINLPIYLLFLSGLWLAFRKRIQSAYLLVTVLLYFVSIHMAVFGYFRYMLPIMPYIILFAAYGFVDPILRKMQTATPKAEPPRPLSIGR